MKRSKAIALSAVTAAFIVIFLCVGALFPSLSLSSIFLSALAVMLPLSKGTKKGALLAVIAGGLLTFLVFTKAALETALPFLLFFGFHPIVNTWGRERGFNKILLFAIKDVWFVATLVACYFLTQMFVTEHEFFTKYMLYIIIFGGAVVFFIYDYMMEYFQKAMDRLIKKLKI